MPHRTAAAIAVLLLACFPSQAELPVRDSTRRAPDLFAEAEKLVLQGSLESAKRAMREIVRKFPDAAEAPRAQYRLAEFAMREGEYVEAFDALDALIVKFPATDLFIQAIEGQTEIAFRVLRRNQIRRVANPDKKRAAEDRELAVNMLRRTLELARHAPQAARAQFLLAAALDESGETEEALRAHETVLERYPASPEAADSAFQLAYIRYRLATGRIGDVIANRHAREAFIDFLNQFPNDPRAPEAKASLEELGARDRRQILAVARWYERTGNPDAAIRYYREVLPLLETPEESAEITAAIARLGGSLRPGASSHDRNNESFIPQTLVPSRSVPEIAP